MHRHPTAFFLSADWSKDVRKRSVHVADIHARRILCAEHRGWNLAKLHAALGNVLPLPLPPTMPRYWKVRCFTVRSRNAARSSAGREADGMRTWRRPPGIPRGIRTSATARNGRPVQAEVSRLVLTAPAANRAPTRPGPTSSSGAPPGRARCRAGGRRRATASRRGRARASRSPRRVVPARRGSGPDRPRPGCPRAGPSVSRR